MHGSAHTRVAERFFLVVDPVRNDHALVKVCARHAWRTLNFSQADWVYRACIIDLASQERGPDFWRPGCEVIELDAIKTWEPLVPVVWVSVHHPDLFIDALLMPERTGARIVHDLAQVIVV